MLERVQACTR